MKKMEDAKLMVVELETHIAELNKVPQQMKDDLKNLLAVALVPNEPVKPHLFLT
jgi:hypothetical protein